MNDENEIDVSLGKDGAKVKLSGEVADRTSRGFGDVFKPLVQYLGEKGDAVQHTRNIKKQVRVFNERALDDALVFAAETAKRLGVRTRPVPLKIVAQWAEGASLEETGFEENLTHSWANLLVTAAAGESRNHNLFIDILKKISPEHAKFLSFLIFDGKDRLWVDYHMEWDEHEMRNHINETQIELVNGLTNEPKNGLELVGLDESEIVNLTRKIFLKFDKIPGVMIDLAQCFFYENGKRMRPNSGGSWDLNFRYDHKLYPEDILDSLISLNLIQKIVINDIAPLRPDCELSISYVRLTNFGAHFIEACLAPDPVTLKNAFELRN